MAVSNSLFKYCKIVNRSDGYNTRKNQLIGEMVSDYNQAVENLITRFSVLVNSVDAIDIFINDAEESVKGVIGTTRTYTASSDIEKYVQLYPNLMKSGDYLTFKVNEYDTLHTYMITSTIERKRGYDEGIFVECNNKLIWEMNGKVYSYPCTEKNSSYGSKQTKSDDRIMTDDTKAKIRVQQNEDTIKLEKSQRFIFSGSQEDIYTIVDIDRSIYPGQIEIVMKKEVLRNEDDLENNIGFNENSNVNYDIDILGLDSIILNNETTFTVKNENNIDLVWEISNSNAIIIRSDNYSCTVKGINRNKTFKLICKNTLGEEISYKNIGITR